MPDADDQMSSSGKNARVVILKHMFSIDELEEDARLMLDLKEDVREECSTIGEVTNVVLYDVCAFYIYFSFPLIFLSIVIERAGRYHVSQVQGSIKCTSLRFGERFHFFLKIANYHTENGRSLF